MGCAIGLSLQEDFDQSLKSRDAQILLLESPIKNLYQPKTIESTSKCESLKWCDEDDDLENLFQECNILEKDVSDANMRILELDENQVKVKHQQQELKTYSQTSICINKKRNPKTKQYKFPDKNEKIPNSILKRKRLKEGQLLSGKMKSKLTQVKAVRFSKCYIRIISKTSFSKNTINFQE